MHDDIFAEETLDSFFAISKCI